MNSFKPISSFKAVYLIDLSPSLCDVARDRFRRCGWKNVHVQCIDANDFVIPEKAGKVDLITMSYSLSMIPSYYSVIDKVAALLAKKTGIIATVDFYVQSNAALMGKSATVGGHLLRHVNWFSRTFWRLWFEFDQVYLDAARRDYLEYRFGTIKSLNMRNKGLGGIPYYIFIGCDKDYSSELERRIDMVATESPYLAPTILTSSSSSSSSPSSPLTVADKQAQAIESLIRSKGYEAAVINLDRNFPYPSFFYQREHWRIFYDFMLPKYNQFGDQYIYAFTWEDPREDIRILDMQPTDTVLAITSAGDNLLAYAAMDNPPRRIHGVDLNPHQNHLMELKLACFRAPLPFMDVWKIFGEGKHPQFMEILVSKLSPHLSSHALQFWIKTGHKTFAAGDSNSKSRGLYDTGSTRWALRLTRWVFGLFGVEKEIKQLCACKTLAEQRAIWESKIRPALFNPVVTRILIANPVFLWKALGVPLNQASMIEGGILRYIIDTIEPLIERSLISSENYFYYLCLMGKYSRDNCPDYLTRRGYTNLCSRKPSSAPSSPTHSRHSSTSTPTSTSTSTNGSTTVISTDRETSILSRIRLHTDTISDVVERLVPGSVSCAIVMDHMDWFPETTAAADFYAGDARSEIRALNRALRHGGRVLLRTSSTRPWYLKVYEQEGFACKAAAVRRPGESIDRVNMYASTWVCTKVGGTMEDAGKRGSIVELKI